MVQEEVQAAQAAEAGIGSRNCFILTQKCFNQQICLVSMGKNPYLCGKNQTTMKRIYTILTVLCAWMGATAQAQDIHDWENPAVLGINKLPYHATLQLPSKEKECPEILSLDGQWFFHWSRNPEERAVDFYREDYDVSQWGKIAVPGNWQTQGYGTPIYININYPFVKDRPRVTTEPPKDWTAYENRNPVGQYVTFVEMTKEMLSQKNLILHFGGVHSAMYVWVNGQKVGYSQNSMSPAEFDVTKYMHVGKNKVAVEVYRWSDGSYLEDQDYWRLSGTTMGEALGAYQRLSGDGCSQCRLLEVYRQCEGFHMQYGQENRKEPVGAVADGLS